jgi:hypothetical protein
MHVLTEAIEPEPVPEPQSQSDSQSEGSEEYKEQVHLERYESSPVLKEITNTTSHCGAQAASNDSELPSLGSKDHDAGTCKRCCFFPKGRCTNGYQCSFCHFDHEKRVRKSKKKRKSGDGVAPLDDFGDAEGAGSTAPPTPGGEAPNSISTPSTIGAGPKGGSSLLPKNVGYNGAEGGSGEIWQDSWCADDFHAGGGGRYDQHFYGYSGMDGAMTWPGSDILPEYVSGAYGFVDLQSTHVDPSSGSWCEHEYLNAWSCQENSQAAVNCTPNWTNIQEKMHVHDAAALACVSEGLHAGGKPQPR